MKNRVASVLILLLLLVFTIASVASAGGNSPAQRTKAGWFCIVAGPRNRVHCVPPGAFKSSASITAQVFDTSDVSSTDAPLHGTQILIRADLYAGQPCASDGGGEYEFVPSSATGLPFDYRTCHHFSTAD